jgi:hypothetical protein
VQAAASPPAQSMPRRAGDNSSVFGSTVWRKDDRGRITLPQNCAIFTTTGSGEQHDEPTLFPLLHTPSGDVVDLDEEFDNRDDAEREAILVARELISDCLRAGRASEFGSIQVRNRRGDVLANISMQDALSRNPGTDF